MINRAQYTARGHKDYVGDEKREFIGVDFTARRPRRVFGYALDDTLEGGLGAYNIPNRQSHGPHRWLKHPYRHATLG